MQSACLVSDPPLVLIADAQDDFVELIVDLLEEEGARCMVAAGGEVAVGLLQTATPDMVLIDLLLPQRSGYDLLAVIARTPRLHRSRVFITSAALPAEVAAATALHQAAEPLPKPFAANVLLAHVRRLKALR